MNNLLKKLMIFCLALIFILGTSYSVLARQIEPQEAEPSVIPLRLPKIVHAGAVQIGLDPTGVSARPLIKADTYLTIVNPAGPCLVPCVENIAESCCWLRGHIIVFNSQGTPVGKTTFKVAPKGNATISLAGLIIKNAVLPDGKVRKYTYEIRWSFPCMAEAALDINCKLPLIPISVEVKEVIFRNWLSPKNIREDSLKVLLNKSRIVKTWSETILSRCNIIYPWLREATVESELSPLVDE